MILRGLKYLFFIIGFSVLIRCTQEEENILIKGYDLLWKKNISDLSDNPMIVVKTHLYSDGILVGVFTNGDETSISSSYLVVTFSSTGSIIGIFETPKHDVLLSATITKDDELMLLLLSNSDPNIIKQILVDKLSNIDEKVFTIDRPNTFHSLSFSEQNVFICQYEAPYPGIRIKAYNYDQQLEWSNRIESKFIKPFPYMIGDDLLFYRSNNLDSVGITKVSGYTGEIEWESYYQPGLTSSLVNLGISILDQGELYLSYYENENNKRKGFFLQISPETGVKIRLTKISLPADVRDIVPVGATIDNGYLFYSDDGVLTKVLKLDSKGNVGWVGTFISGGKVNSNDVNLSIVTPEIIYMLKPTM